MSEERITFQSRTIRIEGLLCMQDGERGAVITHPHPLYGGSMYNQVVEVLARVYQDKGFTTLRFNFRGVGSSEGAYDQGKGEGEDVKAALHYLRKKGKADLDLAGYSFGVWVNATILDSEPLINKLIMVSPPVAFLEFPSCIRTPKIRLVVAGDKDEIAPVDQIRQLIADWDAPPDIEVIEGADHFYSGKIDTLYSVLSRKIT
ncbi:MAG: alpha/beta hydrolase [Thermodesulfobacteriota bacterium]